MKNLRNVWTLIESKLKCATGQWITLALTYLHSTQLDRRPTCAVPADSLTILLSLLFFKKLHDLIREILYLGLLLHFSPKRWFFPVLLLELLHETQVIVIVVLRLKFWLGYHRWIVYFNLRAEIVRKVTRWHLQYKLHVLPLSSFLPPHPVFRGDNPLFFGSSCCLIRSLLSVLCLVFLHYVALDL